MILEDILKTYSIYPVLLQCMAEGMELDDKSNALRFLQDFSHLEDTKSHDLEASKQNCSPSVFSGACPLALWWTSLSSVFIDEIP